MLSQRPLMTRATNLTPTQLILTIQRGLVTPKHVAAIDIGNGFPPRCYWILGADSNFLPPAIAKMGRLTKLDQPINYGHYGNQQASSDYS